MKLFHTPIIVNSALSVLSFLMIATPAFAEESVSFRLTEQSSNPSEAICTLQDESSESSLTRQESTFQIYLPFHLIHEVSSGQRDISIDRLISLSQLKVRGRRSIAEVQEAQVSIEIKSKQQKTLATILYQWSPNFQKDLERISKRNPSFTYIDQGDTACILDDTHNSRNRCFFHVESTSNSLNRSLRYIKNHFPKAMSKGLIIEIKYKTHAYVDCTGTDSFSVISNRIATPVLRLD